MTPAQKKVYSQVTRSASSVRMKHLDNGWIEVIFVVLSGTEDAFPAVDVHFVVIDSKGLVLEEFVQPYSPVQMPRDERQLVTLDTFEPL